MKIVVTKDYTEMCKLASRIFAAQITLKPDSVLGLATGSTPVVMYKELIQMYNEGRVDFSHVKTVNLDEYAGLNGDNDQSYRYFMNHNLFDHININKENTSVPCGTAEDLQAECERYEQLVEQTGGVDIQLLGIGTIMKAKKIVLLANGPKKAQTIYDTVYGPITPKVPASVLRLHPDVTIFVDEEAGALLKK